MIKKFLKDPSKGIKKEDYIQLLNSLRTLPKVLWDFLRTLPEPLSKKELNRLTQKGLIQKIHNEFHLTPKGNFTLTRTNVGEDGGALKALEIAFLQSLTLLPSKDKLKLLEDHSLITNQGGQYILTPLGSIAKTEISAAQEYSKLMNTG